MTEDLVDGVAVMPTAALAHAIPFADGAFYLAGAASLSGQGGSESRKKRVYRGTYVRGEGARRFETPACAVYFVRDGGGADYARELLGLAQAGALGVGPRTLEADAWRRLPGAEDGGPKFPLVVEEDAGVSLADALAGAPIPFFSEGRDLEGAPLPDPASPEGARVAHKILFDVLFQVEALQRQGLYHRDLRSANIALRAWGPGAQGIRATLIDLEFLGGERRGRENSR